MIYLRLYNEAKHLGFSMPFHSFLRHVSQRLPGYAQVYLSHKGINNIGDLERVVGPQLQSIRDGERRNLQAKGEVSVTNVNEPVIQEEWQCFN